MRKNNMRIFLTMVLGLTVYSNMTLSNENCGLLKDPYIETRIEASLQLAKSFFPISVDCLSEVILSETYTETVYDDLADLNVFVDSLGLLLNYELANKKDLGALTASIGILNSLNLRANYLILKVFDNMKLVGRKALEREEFSSLGQDKREYIMSIANDIVIYNLLSTNDPFYRWVLKITNNYLTKPQKN